MKRKMNKSFTAKVAAAAVILSFSAFTKLSAQAIIPASQPETGIGNFGYSNVAAIDYSPFCGGGPCSGLTNPQLTAIVEDDGPGGLTSMLFVSDQTTALPAAVWLALPPGSSPDVIVGNNLATPTDYLIGVVATISGDVYLYEYKVSNVGLGGLSVTLVSGPIPLTTGHNVIGAAHIDAIAKYSAPFSGSSLPTVDRFAVIWNDNSSGIVAYYSSLNSPGTGTTQVLNPNTNMSYPDIAAVERYNPVTGGYDDWALATYIDNSGAPMNPGNLYYQEWPMSMFSGVLAPILYDNTNTYDITYAPGVTPIRIDAIDDNFFNIPGGGNASFVIAGSVTSHSGGKAIVEYNDKTGPLVANDITALVTGVSGRTNILPVVACGPGNFYTVGYYTASQNYYATSIDWSTGLPTTDPNAYEVPLTPYSVFGGSGWINGIGLAATCNNDVPGQQNLAASFEIMGVLYEKGTSTAAPYGFKHNNASQIPTAISHTEWVVAPNPASDFIVLAAPSGFDPGEHATYKLQDVMGRVITSGAIKSASETIALSDVASGMYFLNICNGKSVVKTTKVVKQ